MKFRIREARERAGYSQKELAEIIGVAQNTFHGYESGKHDPKSELLSKIATACNVTVDFLLGRDTEHPSVIQVDFGHGEMGAKKAPPLSGEAMRLAKDYDSLDRWGRQALRELAETELQRMEDEKRFKIFSLCFKWSITILCIVCELRKPPCWAVFFYFSQD